MSACSVNSCSAGPHRDWKEWKKALQFDLAKRRPHIWRGVTTNTPSRCSASLSFCLLSVDEKARRPPAHCCRSTNAAQRRRDAGLGQIVFNRVNIFIFTVRSNHKNAMRCAKLDALSHFRIADWYWQWECWNVGKAGNWMSGTNIY